MSTDPSGGDCEHRDGDHWSELEKVQARMVAKALEPALASMRAAMQPVVAGFPSFTSQLADTMRAMPLPKVAVSDESIESLRHLAAINSPVPGRIHDLVSSIHMGISADLVKNPAIDQEIVRWMQDIARDTQRAVKNLQAQLAPFAEGLSRAVLPPNLRDLVEEISAREVNEFVEQEAIPLYLVPRSRTALRLIHARDRQARRKVLNSCFTSIIDDCESVLAESKSEVVADQVAIVTDGIGAMRAGYVHSAQALFTVTLDTLITRLYPDENNLKLLKNRKKDAVPPEEFDEMGIREALVWLPIWNAHEEFWPKKGDLVPHHFSRHASVHAVSSRQFNKRNCIQALMLVTSLIGYANGRW